jgi:ATP-dependent helicase/nuclease subunit A
MTRAAERLIVCGTKGVNKIPEGCWHQLVREALEAECVRESADDGNEVLRYRKGEAEAAPTTIAIAAPKEISLPSWLARDVLADKPALLSVTPSSVMEDDETRPRAAAGVKVALLRGALTHHLLQSLPDIAPERRAKAMDDFLARRGQDLPADERKALAGKVTGLLANPRFAPLFAPGSRAEVPIVGKVQTGGGMRRVSGQVDRLVVTADAVLIADFKTNRPVPRIAPPGYVRQLALYRAVLAKLYPGRSVRCAVIWTENPDLMELSDEALDTALTQITPA